MSKQIITIYSAYTHNSSLYSKALQELHPQLTHQTITATGLPYKRRNKQQVIQLFNELKYQAFNQATPIIFIAEKGLYPLDQTLIHTHLCKGLPVKLYTPTQTIVFGNPQSFKTYLKEQVRAYYQAKQNKIYYQELRQLAEQFNISKAALDKALTKHRNKLISEGKTTNAYESYLGIFKSFLIQKWEEAQTPEPTPEYENFSLIDDITLMQLQAIDLPQLQEAAKLSQIPHYLQLTKDAIINALIPILYPEPVTTHTL